MWNIGVGQFNSNGDITTSMNAILICDLLVQVCDVYCDFVTFPFGILGQVRYLIVYVPDPCCLFYFNIFAE